MWPVTWVYDLDAVSPAIETPNLASREPATFIFEVC
jgi:hypothetical protein